MASTSIRLFETPADPLDPARYTAVTPEPATQRERPENVDHAVGIGPGDSSYLAHRARTVLEDADVVVGFESVVDFITEATDATLRTCGYDDEAAVLEKFATRVAAGDRATAVLIRRE